MNWNTLKLLNFGNTAVHSLLQLNIIYLYPLTAMWHNISNSNKNKYLKSTVLQSNISVTIIKLYFCNNYIILISE